MLRPLHDRIVVTRKKLNETTSSGLFLPAAAQEKSNLATVVAVGTGRLSDSGEVFPMSVQVGQTVLLGPWKGEVIQIEGVDHIVIREVDVIAVVEE